MATAAQIEANRANSKNSTGPRTPEGKARSSINNLRDGFRSQSVLLPGDDPADYDALLAALQEHFTTRDLTEQRSVREMAGAEWRLRRTRRMNEDAYWKEFENVRTQFPALSESTLDLRTFENLHQPGSSYPRLMTYEAKFERQYDRAYRHWVQYNKDTARARSQELLDRVNAVFAAPFPEIPPQIATDEANFAPAPAENRTDEANPALRPSPGLKMRAIAALGIAPAGDTEAHQPSPPPHIVEPRVPPIGPRAQSGVSPLPATPRNSPCPCGAGLKYKRCCGRNAPPQLFPASRAT